MTPSLPHGPRPRTPGVVARDVLSGGGMTLLSSLSLRAGAAVAVLFASWLLVYPVRLWIEGVWLQSYESLACFLLFSLQMSALLLLAAHRAWTEASRRSASDRAC
ncbi:MAG: hypothetical protein KF878_16100 [Planctomycetes bacterium]|nr:hypothetical protein [Planctomycetota bacterium]